MGLWAGLQCWSWALIHGLGASEGLAQLSSAKPSFAFQRALPIQHLPEQLEPSGLLRAINFDSWI